MNKINTNNIDSTMILKRTSIFFLVIFFMTSCGNNIVEPDRTTPLESITIDLTKTYQSIFGFGGCNTVFNGVASFPKESDMQKAYGTGDDELGLSIFRVSIPSNPSDWAAVAEVAKFAQDRGAIVFASPWDAPDDLLDPDHDEKRILPEKYDDYVAHLNSFDDYMQGQGVNLHAISIQNEPDIGEWTQWTVFEIEDFTRNHASGINTKVITAESFNFNRSYYNNILNDDVAVNNIDIVGGHIYGNGLGEFVLAEQKGKEIWMTEYLLNDYTGQYNGDPRWGAFTEKQKWEQTLEMLNTVHESMKSNWNAYIWWYLKRYYSFIGEGEQGSTDGEILKRGYAFSHFSKFIRPGYIRVDIDNPDLTNLDVTAYEGDGKVVVQLINPSTDITPNFYIDMSSSAIISAKMYETNLEKNRVESTVQIDKGKAKLQISPESIVTVIFEM